MNYTRLLGTLAGTAVLFTGAANAGTIMVLSGDIDSFGTDKPAGSAVSVAEIIAAPLDAGDGDTDRWNLNLYTFAYSYLIPLGEQIVSATFEVVTLDMEDDGAGDGQGGGPFDDTLTIDGMDVAGAFDMVYTPDGTGTTPLTPNHTTFVLDPSFFAALSDGMATFVIDPAGGSQKDAIAVDYAKLTIETAPVPLPAALPLFAAGIAGVGAIRRKVRKA